MPDLSRDAIQRWFEQNGLDAIQVGAEASNHCDEHAEVLPRVLRLGAAFDGAGAADAGQLATMLAAPSGVAKLGPILAHLSAARRLRLVHWLHEADNADAPRIVAGLIGQNDSDAGAALRSWFLDLQRRELLTRLFMPERVEVLLAACRSANNPEQPT